MKKNNNVLKVIIFDGICLLCNSAVYFLHKKLRYRDYKFVASQTDDGNDYIQKYNLGAIPLKSIVLIKDQMIFTKSDAVFEILDDMPKLWSILKIFKVVPRKIRNWFYDIISKYRHVWFGKMSDQ